MKILKILIFRNKFQNSAIAIGNFDGFHLGHQRVIKIGKQIAEKKKAKIWLDGLSSITSNVFNKKN